MIILPLMVMNDSITLEIYLHNYNIESWIHSRVLQGWINKMKILLVRLTLIYILTFTDTYYNHWWYVTYDNQFWSSFWRGGRMNKIILCKICITMKVKIINTHDRLISVSIHSLIIIDLITYKNVLHSVIFALAL